MKPTLLVALLLTAITPFALAAKKQLEAGSTVTATFISPAALKGYRTGGYELLTLDQEPGCKIIALTERKPDGFFYSIGVITPQRPVCHNPDLNTDIVGKILPSRIATEPKTARKVEFIVAETVSL